jgi:hypothetical protein
VLEPNGRVLAAEMKRCIEEAEMRSARSIQFSQAAE